MSTVSPSNYDNVNNIIPGFYMLLPYLFNKNINTYVIRRYYRYKYINNNRQGDMIILLIIYIKII